MSVNAARMSACATVLLMLKNSFKPLPAVAARLGIIAAGRAVTKGSGFQTTSSAASLLRAGCIVFTVLTARAEIVTVENAQLALKFDLSNRGIALTSIRNKSNGVEHLARTSAVFELSAEGFVVRSDSGVAVDSSSSTGQGSGLSVRAHLKDLPLGLEMQVEAPSNEPVALIRITLTNSSTRKLSLHTVIPSMTGLVTAGPASQRMGMVPTEVGSVAPLENTAPPSPLDPSRKPPLGMRFTPRMATLDAMNSMEVASIYDAAGTGGLFFADVDADLDNDIAPLQFNLSALGVSGYWLTDLEPGQTIGAPPFAIGVHSNGDWHAAVDYYVKQHRPRWKFAAAPAWFRDPGAIYGFSGGGAGGIYLMYPGEDLKQHIDSFRQLPKLLDQAQRLGTNVVYIWDFWEGDAEHGRAYSNKGDYLPRTDLGGIPAFVEGVKAIHARGGRIIVYVEAFIISYFSHIGREKGQQWGGRDAAGELYQQYRNNYSMVSSFVPWQDYVVSVAKRLVGEYGVDGIFLDSWAWRMNIPMKTQQEGVLYTSKQYSQGVLTLADKVRDAIQAIKPDAVLVGETTAGPIARHWHGGLSADFAWMAGINQEKILGSPVRYGVPEVNFMTNGRTLGELNQMYAAGHNLALCDAQLPLANYIKPLVEIRQRYKDALIYGSQAYQPSTGNAEVAAYYYQGSTNRLITAVNTAAQRNYTGDLSLREGDANTIWQDLVSEETFKAAGNKLHLKIPPGGLRVLIRR